jgi:hypothetical protein
MSNQAAFAETHRLRCFVLNTPALRGIAIASRCRAAEFAPTEIPKLGLALRSAASDFQSSSLSIVYSTKKVSSSIGGPPPVPMPASFARSSWIRA